MKYEELLELDEKRTQGDWRVNRCEMDFCHIACEGVEFVTVTDTADIIPHNAQFIAAAPEMMKLLKKYRKALEWVKDQLIQNEYDEERMAIPSTALLFEGYDHIEEVLDETA